MVSQYASFAGLRLIALSDMERVPENVPEVSIEKIIESSNIAIDEKTGMAVVVIKPEAFRYRDAIVQKIEHTGLSIVSRKHKQLPENFVLNAMYPNLSESLQQQTAQHFNEGESEILLIKGGNDLVEKLVTLAGEHTNPAVCDTNSIRYLFGEHFARETSDGGAYYRNAVHRPKDESEREHDLEEFKHLV